ncbi:MAG TPA: glycosyltransferase family 39 protein [Syntrophorhabdaceae bacterium]
MKDGSFELSDKFRDLRAVRGTSLKILMLILLSYVLLVHNLGGVALWDPDEPRQAIVAREMVERNDYIHTYLNGEPNRWKPPFYSWMIILASKVTGNIDELASKAPSAIAAGLLVLITFFLGSHLVDTSTGFLSAMVLLTNYQFLGNARESVMDMTFAFFIGLTVFLNYLAIKKDNRWQLVLSFIPASLAILTKGPAGLLIPACVIFIYLMVTKKVKRFTLTFACGCFFSLSLAMIWFLLAGREYINEIILTQSFTRYVNAFDHQENLFYYFHKLFFNFLPWSILLPFSIYHAFRQKYWLPLIWFLFTFLFFEISTSKRAIYLLSVYPASALLCGFYIRDSWSRLVKASKTNMFLRVFAFLLVTLPLGAVVALFNLQNETVTEFRTNPSVYVYIALIFMAGAIFLYTLVKNCEKGSLFLLFAYLILIAISHNFCYLPIMDKAFKSPRLITDSMKDFSKGKDVFLYGDNSAGLIFYIGKPTKLLHRAEDIKKYAKTESVLVITEDDAKYVAPYLDKFYYPIKKVNYEREAYILYVGKSGI